MHQQSLTPESQRVMSQVTPGATPPAGVAPNFVDRSDTTGAAIALHTVLLTFVTACVIIRVYTRTLIDRAFRIDDCMAHDRALGSFPLTSVRLLSDRLCPLLRAPLTKIFGSQDSSVVLYLSRVFCYGVCSKSCRQGSCTYSNTCRCNSRTRATYFRPIAFHADECFAGMLCLSSANLGDS